MAPEALQTNEVLALHASVCSQASNDFNVESELFSDFSLERLFWGLSLLDFPSRELPFRARKSTGAPSGCEYPVLVDNDCCNDSKVNQLRSVR